MTDLFFNARAAARWEIAGVTRPPNFDPVWSSAYVVRNAGLLVWDTLYGIDSTLTSQRQMVEARKTSSTSSPRSRPRIVSDANDHSG